MSGQTRKRTKTENSGEKHAHVQRVGWATAEVDSFFTAEGRATAEVDR